MECAMFKCGKCSGTNAIAKKSITWRKFKNTKYTILKL